MFQYMLIHSLVTHLIMFLSLCLLCLCTQRHSKQRDRNIITLNPIGCNNVLIEGLTALCERESCERHTFKYKNTYTREGIPLAHRNTWWPPSARHTHSPHGTFFCVLSSIVLKSLQWCRISFKWMIPMWHKMIHNVHTHNHTLKRRSDYTLNECIRGLCSTT